MTATESSVEVLSWPTVGKLGTLAATRGIVEPAHARVRTVACSGALALAGLLVIESNSEVGTVVAA